MRISVFIFLLFQSLLSMPAGAQEISSVTICYDPVPPSPDGEKKYSDETRFFNGLVNNTFARIGIKVRFITDYPFKRCMAEVENRRIDFVLGAYFDNDRAKIFDYSNHYYTLTPQIFFLSARPVTINQLADLKHYRGCGIYGSSYAHYGLKPEVLDLGPGYDSMIKKLHAGRCDYFVEELEVIRELKSTGHDYLSDASIRHADVPGATAPSRYLITAKNSKVSPLLGQINKALEEVIALPETHEAWKKEFGSAVYKP